MKHIVSISGGSASAVAANRVLERYPTDTVLWFADTLWEDPDLHRFLRDLEQHWGRSIIRHVEGLTPLQVAEKRKIIPNQRLAPCSLVLKIEPFRRYIKAQPKPLTIHLGLDWTEMHRMEAPKRRYEELQGISVDFPLMWEPIETRPYSEVVKEWGIEIPALYKLGFPHNNCGGRCVRQGNKEWARLQQTHPERYAEVEKWEQEQQAKGGARANYAIARDQRNKQVKPVSLRQLRERRQELPIQESFEDRFACFCEY